MKTDVRLNGKDYEVEVSSDRDGWVIDSVVNNGTEIDDEETINVLYDYMRDHMDIDADLAGYLADTAYDTRDNDR